MWYRNPTEFLQLVRRADIDEWRRAKDGEPEASTKCALKADSRTESDGVAFEALQHVLAGAPPFLIPVPDSKRAEPLRISLKPGPWRCEKFERGDITIKVNK